jgi:glycosyltransferase involved in cell wall biosynthesis
MRVLLSAYACEPGKGSEPEIGWNWALEISRLGHECCVITRENNVDVVLAAARVHCPNLRVVGYDLPKWASFWKKGIRGMGLYYRMWQCGVWRRAARLVKEEQFDVVHHVTFGVFRQPSFMGELGIPFVIGVGAGEVMPKQFFWALPFKAKMNEIARDIGVALGRIDPWVRGSLGRAMLIFCRTKRTLEILPAAVQERAVVLEDVGTLQDQIGRSGDTAIREPRFLFAGRLVACKGLHLAFEALALLRKEIPSVSITVAGNGTDEAWLRRRAKELGLQKAVNWVGKLTHAEMLTLYSSHVAFIFPSLHDAGPLVIPESYARGLPVICLDIGGPSQLLPDGCGYKVSVEGRSSRAVVVKLAEAMSSLATDPGLRKRMSDACIEAARERTWQKLVARAYDMVAVQLAARDARLRINNN